MDSKQLWLKYVHPEYRENIHKWIFTADFYNGEFLTNETKLSQYLVMRKQGESIDAYKERQMLLDYTGVFPHVVDSLAGMLFAAENKTKRVWDDPDNNALGSPDNESSPAGQLWLDADGLGTDWETLFKQATVDLILFQRKWCLVDGFTEGRDVPTVHMIDPMDVTNWKRERDGRLSQVLVREYIDTRTSIQDPPNYEEQYVLYTFEGWQRFRIVNGSVKKLTDPEAEGTYSYVDIGGQPILPIFLVTLPIRRNIGYLLARKNMIIMNRESSRDQSLRVAEFAKLVLSANDSLFDKLTESLKQGANVLQVSPQGGTHQYITSAHEPARLGTEILKEKIKNFYITAFQEYSDAARMKTATEIRQDLAKGVGAFLEIISSAVDELENQAMKRIEQALFNTPSKWGKAYVQRPSEFMPEDRIERAQIIRNIFFPDGVPIGKTAKFELVKLFAEIFNFPIDEDEVKTIIASKEATEAQDNDFSRLLFGES